MNGEIIVRRATPEDGEDIVALIEGLANYEKLPPPDKAAKSRILDDMFSERPPFETYIARVDGRTAGYAITFPVYSTFRGRPKLYLEDIFVVEEFRSSGVGLALFREAAREAARKGCEEMEWEVLTWNQLAIDFYKRLGARPDTGWQTYILQREHIERLINDDADDD